MNDKANFLKELRIERSEVAAPKQGGRSKWWLAIGAGALLVCGTGWAVLARPHAMQVKAITASIQQGAAVGGSATILDASGYVVARRQATVSAKITGKLAELFIEDGQHVKAGEVLAKLDDTNTMAELQQARAQVAQAEVSVVAAKGAVSDATPIYERSQKREALGLISHEAMDNSKSAYNNQQNALHVAQANLAVQRAAMQIAQRNEDDTVVRAPFSGVITSKNAQPGEIISPLSAGGAFTRSGIGTLVDMDSLEVEVDVNESFISRVHPDAPTVLKLNAYPDWQIPAYVIAVVPTADRSKATVKVRIGFKVRDARILPEMGARVSFLDESRVPANAQPTAPAPRIVLPADAVQASGGPAGSGVVFVLHGDTVERRIVKVGPTTSAGVPVLAGVAAGERVAVGDLRTLADGAHVSEATP